jgi:PAS domain S-box-containing protein
MSTLREQTESTKVESIFRNLLEAAPDAMVVVNGEGQMIFVNARTEALFGYPQDELLDQTVELLVPSRYRGTHKDHRQKFSAEKRARAMGEGAELFGRRSDGTEFPVEISLSPLQTEDGVLVVSAIRDVSARKEMEAQLEASRAQIAASARLSALGIMAGGIAHEINNPLGIIHAYGNNLLEMAQQGEARASDVEKASARIVETAERISGIIRSLQHVARDGSGDAFHPASVRDMVEHALELCRERCRVHSVRLQVPDVDPGLRVRCRQVQITQVILNLLQNAFDAVDGIEGEKWIAVEIAKNNETLILSVLDSGPGVPSELKHRIMEPFFTTKPVGKGTGLGLSISKNIARSHGGDLRLSEQQGHTCFSLILPLGEESQANAT